MDVLYLHVFPQDKANNASRKPILTPLSHLRLKVSSINYSINTIILKIYYFYIGLYIIMPCLNYSSQRIVFVWLLFLSLRAEGMSWPGLHPRVHRKSNHPERPGLPRLHHIDQCLLADAHQRDGQSPWHGLRPAVAIIVRSAVYKPDVQPEKYEWRHRSGISVRAAHEWDGHWQQRLIIFNVYIILSFISKLWQQS